MSRKYLRNPKTGVVFPYSELLAKSGKLEPCDKNGRSLFAEVDPDDMDFEPEPDLPVGGGAEEPEQGGAVDGSGGIILEKATKAELADYAQRHYGHTFAARATAEQMRDELRTLIENE